ncbi:MAG: OmpA family protein [Pseudomonadota bacterium]
MTRRPALTLAACALAALGLSGAVAIGGVRLFERQMAAQAGAVLIESDTWLRMDVSGMQLRLSGDAPDATARAAALVRLAAAETGLRIVDATGLRESAAPAAPEAAAVDWALEILVAPEGVSLIGTVAAEDLTAGRLRDRLPPDAALDLLDSAAETPPAGWRDTLEFALRMLPRIDRGSLRLEPGALSITAQVADARTAHRLREDLAAAQPGSVAVDTDIQIPMPVLSPFTYRARLEAGHLTVTRCSAGSVEDANAIARQGAAIAATAGDHCRVGLGAPDPAWADVVTGGLAVLRDLGGGMLDVVDADVAVIALPGAPEAPFRARVAEFEAALPALFALTALVPPDLPLLAPSTAEEEAPADAGATARFVAVLAQESGLLLEGALPDRQVQEAAATLALARFGGARVRDETQVQAALPPGWSGHVVAGLEALALLQHGRLEITENALRLSGAAGSIRVESEIRTVLAAHLLASTQVELSIEEVPVAAGAGPRVVVPAALCSEQIAVLLEGGQIVFPPSESTIDADSAPILDRIAEILAMCPGARFEIAGHTDAQGRESSNMALSQARADAVMGALLMRGVDSVFLRATGYGETEPIASNDTEAGRALNRRIAFGLVSEEDWSTGSARPPVDEEAALPVESADPATGGRTADTASDGAVAPDAIPTRTATEPVSDLGSDPLAVDAEAVAPVKIRPLPRPATGE